METGDLSSWLHFLRFSLKPKSGGIDRKLFRKPSTQPVFITADSHHPDSIKSNSIINQFQSFEKICDNEVFYEEACTEFTDILLSNGYEREHVDKLKDKSRSIYSYLKFVFSSDSTSFIDKDDMSAFMKKRHLKVSHCKGDGFCLLYAVSTNTGLSVQNMIPLIEAEINKNIDHYIEFLGCSATEIHVQATNYFLHKKYNQPIVDIMPNIISSCLGRTVYIFQSLHNKVSITSIPCKISNLKPILLRRVNNNHYDALTSKSKWRTNNFKKDFKQCSILKLPYINEQHYKEIKSILHNYNFNILPIFTSGTKFRGEKVTRPWILHRAGRFL